MNQGGGATRASTNADSYAWLANSKYWYDLTGYFPRPPNYKSDDYSANAAQASRELDAWRIDFGKLTETTSDQEITDRLNGITKGFGVSAPSSKPSKGKSLSIAMTSIVNSHSGSATIDYSWNFYTTSVGKAVGSCGETDGKKIEPQGPTDYKLPSGTNMDKAPWPAGDFKLNIEDQDCYYKCDGTNPGRLFCPSRQIECKKDDAKEKADGVKKCGSRVNFRAVVYCDF